MLDYQFTQFVKQRFAGYAVMGRGSLHGCIGLWVFSILHLVSMIVQLRMIITIKLGNVNIIDNKEL